MIVTVSQPQFCPQTYFVHRLVLCDKIVWMDEAQHTRNHTRGLVGDGERTHYITLPCAGGRLDPFYKKVISEEKENQLRNKFRGLLHHCYRKAPYYKVMMEIFNDAIDNKNLLSSGVTLDKAGYMWNDILEELFGKDTLPESYFSRDIVPERPENACQWVYEMAKGLNPDKYIQGSKSIQSYFTVEFFKEDLPVYGQNFVMPKYRKGEDLEQVQGLMSIIDPLMYLGGKGTYDMLMEQDISKMIPMKVKDGKFYEDTN